MILRGRCGGSKSGFVVRRALLALLRLYQRWISPLKRAPTCRFLPSCSEYACEAVKRYGALRGTVLFMWRLLRCHPLARGGIDLP